MISKSSLTILFQIILYSFVNAQIYWEDNDCPRGTPEPEMDQRILLGYEFRLDMEFLAGIEKGVVPGSLIKIGILNFGCEKYELEVQVMVNTALYPNLDMTNEDQVSHAALQLLHEFSSKGISANLLALCDEVYGSCLEDGYLLRAYQPCNLYPKSPVPYIFQFEGITQEGDEYQFKYYYSVGPYK